METYINKKKFSLHPTKIIGSGGEADIYKIASGTALKLFKNPDHVDFEASLSDQKSAVDRIAEHQNKLKQLPAVSSPYVITPNDLSYDKYGMINGYTMDMIDNAEVLLRYGMRNFRDGFVSDQEVIQIFRNLFTMVSSVHKSGVTIGDFNDLNVLVKGTQPYLIDFDSAQFGNYYCKVFTSKFVDPLLCNAKAKSPSLIKPHNHLSDWYAYIIMLMQSLLFVGPYGGVYKPKNRSKKIAPDARPLKRISVFHKDVIYPKPARSLDSLPDSLLSYLKEVFEEDKREEFPIGFMDALQFDANGNLLSTMKDNINPIRQKEVITGSIAAQKVFSTSGRIVYVTIQSGKLVYVYYNDGVYYRENGDTIMNGKLDHKIRFRIQGSQTIVAKGSKVFIFGASGTENLQVDTYGALPLVDGNASSLFFVQNGNVNKSGALGPSYCETIGQALSNQTLFWVGDSLGFGFYRAGGLSRFFSFRTDVRGLNDNIKIPTLKGQIIDTTCVFSKENIWFLISTREGGKTINYCYLIDNKGVLRASYSSSENGGDWLESIRGKCAIGNMLFCPTDDGMVRVEPNGTILEVTKQFTDTTRFIDSQSQLLPGKNGILTINSNQTIWNIQMK